MNTTRRIFIQSCLIALALAGVAAAQPIILDVVGTASRFPSGFPNSGIAQGGLFSIIGARLGPDQLVQATFPLPTTDGLSGVTVQIKVGGVAVDGIMVYAVDKEVAVILPSRTPTGTGTVTITTSTGSATAPITVVASAPGIFNLGTYTGIDGSSSAPSLSFNTGGDGTLTQNLPITPAQPGQTIVIAATGAGAIQSDETQSGVADVPAAQLQVFVASKSATGVSVSRGTYPTLSPNLPAYIVPQGIAAMDMITFTVPDGVSGCILDVYVRSGEFVSNPAFISVSPDGSPCVDPTAVAPGDSVTLNGTAHTATIDLNRIVTRTTNGGLTAEIAFESGLASFIQYDVPNRPATAPVAAYGFLASNLDVGSCNMQYGRSIVPSPLPPVPRPTPDPNAPQILYLNAGAALNIKGPKSTMQLKLDKTGHYSGSLGDSFLIPPSPASGDLFLDPGSYTLDNGSGGPDVAGFSGNLTISDPQLQFTDIDQIATVDRAKGVTVHWTGGDPNGFVTILGTSTNVSNVSTSGMTTLIGSFQCTERASVGRFTIPDYVTRALPVTNSSTTGPAGLGSIGMTTYSANRINIPGFDLGLLTYEIMISRSMVYK